MAALDLVFWRVPWAREAVRMYELMERRVLRAVQYILLTWEPDDVSEMAIRVPLAATTRRPVRRIDYLPPVIAGPYREHLSYLAPEEPEQPYLAVLTSYDFAGEWDATLFHELTHAYQSARGAFATGSVDSYAPGDGGEIDRSEYQAVGLGDFASERYTENAYRDARSRMTYGNRTLGGSDQQMEARERYTHD